MAQCVNHPDRKARARGLCSSCYQLDWQRRNPDKTWRAAHPEKKKAANALYYARNKDKINARATVWQKNNPERAQRIYRRSRYAKLGVTIEQYDELLKTQRGRCAACGDEPKKTLLAVDHDHKTGAIRGLLCPPCNTGLGYFRDSPERLRAAADYLEAHPA